MAQTTGWPKSKSVISNGCTSRHFCISDAMLVKPKCVCEAVVFLTTCKQTTQKCKQIFKNWKKTTASQTHFGFTNIFRVSEVQPFEIIDFDFGHPVTYSSRK